MQTLQLCSLVHIFPEIKYINSVLHRTHGQVQTGLGSPRLSVPTLHCASWPQGFGWQRLPDIDIEEEDPPPTPRFPTDWPGLVFCDLLQVPPRPALGSPSVPGGQEHSARWSTALQFAVGLQQGEPPQKVGPHGSMQDES